MNIVKYDEYHYLIQRRDIKKALHAYTCLIYHSEDGEKASCPYYTFIVE